MLPLNLTLRFGNTDDGCYAYEHTVEITDENTSTKYLKYYEESEEFKLKITCSLNNSRCKAGVYHADIDESCTSKNMTVNLEIGETNYGHTGIWEHTENSAVEHYNYPPNDDPPID